jgi:hypothetical protein
MIGVVGIKKLYNLVTGLSIVLMISCGQDDTYRIPLNVNELQPEKCEFEDAVLKEDGCYLYACHYEQDKNYNQFLDYQKKVTVLNNDPKIKNRYYLFHDAKKCEKDKWVMGCTQKFADNYEPSAVIDNCSCEFSFCSTEKLSANSPQDEYLHYQDKTLCEKKKTFLNNCGINDACLCNGDAITKNFNSADLRKVFVITEKTVLNELSKIDAQNRVVSVGHLMAALKPKDITMHQHIKSYIDGYVLDDHPDSQLNELIPRTYTKKILDDKWLKSNDEYLVEGAPYTLLAVVFRPDLEKFNEQNKLVAAGQGRFIFSLNATASNPENHKPSHIILEYWLPVNSTVSAKDWMVMWSKLKCLSGNAYVEHLKNIIQKFAFTQYDNRNPFDAIRVNDFRGREFDPKDEWALFEFKITERGFERMPLKLTPKDNGSDSIEVRAHGQNYSETLSDAIVQNFIAQFNNISDPSKEYSIPTHLQAMQNTFTDNATWGDDLKNKISQNDEFINTTSAAKRTYAMYRYSINTCVGCHSGAFINHRESGFHAYSPLLNSKEVQNIYGKINFSSITRTNFGILHVFPDGSFSSYLQEDLIYRSRKVQEQLTLNYCRLK